MIWRVPKMWEDGECWIIGGGQSIFEQFEVPELLQKKILAKDSDVSECSKYFSILYDKHVIGINMAYRLGTWIDILFFGDKGLFFGNQKEIAEYPKLRVSCHPFFKRNEFIKYLARDRKQLRGMTEDNSKVVWNGNSGAAAINMAIHTGVKRIVLLGFDMSMNGKPTHWHKFYNQRSDKRNDSIFKRHLSGFPSIAKHAYRLGVEILNANPNSAITSFRKISVKEIL